MDIKIEWIYKNRYLNKLYSYESREHIERWHLSLGTSSWPYETDKGVNRYRNCGEEDGALAMRELLINYRKNMCSGSGEHC